MKVIADLDYICGGIRTGYIEYNVPDNFKDEFLKMSEKEQEEHIFNRGVIKIDDFDIDDVGNIINIQIINDGNTGMA